MPRRLLLLPLMVLSLLAPTAAWAVTSGSVVQALQREPVYVEAGVGLDVDVAAVREAVADATVPVFVAIVSEQTALRAGGTAGLVQRIGEGTRVGSSSVLVLTDEPALRGASGRTAQQAGVDGAAAANQVEAGVDGRDGLDRTEVTAAVVQFVGILDQQAAGSGQVLTRDGEGGNGGLVLGLLALGGAGLGAGVLTRDRRRRRTALEADRADVESLYGRLASDVSLLSPGEDRVAGQALADAAERYAATGALLAQADTPGEYAAARRTAVEGLAATRVVRGRLGLDLGPDVPLPPGTGPQLQEPTRVQVGDEEHDGSPTYAPGRGHYYGGGMLGGRAVPGGWYGVPFWETALMASVLTGGFAGGGLLGGGGDQGGDRGGDGGDDRGGDDAGDVFRGGGGSDWGGGPVGGGDWGGGSEGGGGEGGGSDAGGGW